MQIRTRHAWLVFLLTLPLFLAGLADREFIDFECRFGLFAKEMLRNGISWFPTTYGQPYPDYPGLQTALIVLTSLPMGRVTIFSAVLPTAVFASLTLVFTFLLGAARSSRLGIIAVLLSLATVGFFSTARTPSLDHFVVAATVFTAWAVWIPRRPAERWSLLALGLAVGFAFRGPIGLVVPASVAIVHFALEGDWKRLGLASLLASVLFAVGLAALWLAAGHQGGEIFRRQVIGLQSIGRWSESGGKPFFYYWLRAPGVYALSFPLAGVAAAVSWRKVLRGGDAEARWLRFLVGWILVILIGLSLPAAKKDRYILPAVPAASLLAAALFLDPARGRAARIVQRVVPIACFLAPFAGLVSLLAVPLVAGRLGYPFELRWVKAAFLFAVEAAAAVATFKVMIDGTRRLSSLLALGCLAIATLQVFVIEPLLLSLEPSADFVQQVEAIRGPSPLVFFGLGPDAEDIKYAVNLERDVRPIFLRKAEEVASFGGPACMVTMKENERPLREKFRESFRLLAEGNLGHRRCIAFSVMPQDAGR